MQGGESRYDVRTNECGSTRNYKGARVADSTSVLCQPPVEVRVCDRLHELVDRRNRDGLRPLGVVVATVLITRVASCNAHFQASRSLIDTDYSAKPDGSFRKR